MAEVVNIPEQYRRMVEGAAARYGLPPRILALVLNGESAWNPRAVGDGGTSFGLAQIHMPAHPGVSREQAMNPSFAIDWTARRLGAAYKRYNGNEMATILYHNGPVMGEYMAKTGKFGPTEKLAAAGQRYLNIILRPIGGLKGLGRTDPGYAYVADKAGTSSSQGGLKSQKTGASKMAAPPPDDPVPGFISAMERAATTQEETEEADPLADLKQDLQAARQRAAQTTAMTANPGARD